MQWLQLSAFNSFIHWPLLFFCDYAICLHWGLRWRTSCGAHSLPLLGVDSAPLMLASHYCWLLSVLASWFPSVYLPLFYLMVNSLSGLRRPDPYTLKIEQTVWPKSMEVAIQVKTPMDCVWLWFWQLKNRHWYCHRAAQSCAAMCYSHLKQWIHNLLLKTSISIS